MKSAELKPCPFCGSDGDLAAYSHEESIDYQVECTNAKCRLAMPLPFHTKENAIQNWNTRIPDALQSVGEKIETRLKLKKLGEQDFIERGEWSEEIGKIYACEISVLNDILSLFPEQKVKEEI